ncbi:MAG: hypothetical protein ACT4P6_14835 [Gemmatimonadaceae bacterium]
MSESFEEHERTLEPHRVEEQRNARQEAEDRLRDRNIPIYATDSDDEVADFLDAIERFESAVEALGGDLMVNRIGASEPQDPDFVPPVRGRDERAEEYRARILAATSELRRRHRAD